MRTAVCCICGYENDYLRDWVEYYKNLGFTNILLYDHNDSDGEDIHDVINDYINNGFVIVVNVKDMPLAMFPSYNNCLKQFGNSYDWIAYFDVDEYLCLTKHKTIEEYINSFSNEIDCIQINQMNMDDNDLLYNDGRPLIERFTRPIKKYLYNEADNVIENTVVKSIIKCTKHNINKALFYNPHFPDYCECYANGNGNKLLKGWYATNDIYWETAYIKHFGKKTITEFLYNKILKGTPDISYHRHLEHNDLEKTFFTFNKHTKEKDEIVKKFYKDNKDTIQEKLNEETEDVSLFVMTHKKIEYPILPNFKILQCGADLNESLYDIKDNTGNNISKLNKFYSECTGIYWVWKNVNTSIKGQMQYRRFFDRLDPYTVKYILNNKADIITISPYVWPGYTIKQQFNDCLDINDLNLCKDIISRLYPNYIESYDAYIEHGNILFYSNIFIAKSKIYDELCKFCFDILFEFDKITNYTDEKTSYEHAKHTAEMHKSSDITGQVRLQGHIFERLVTLYILHNKLNVYNCGNPILKEKNMKG